MWACARPAHMPVASHEVFLLHLLVFNALQWVDMNDYIQVMETWVDPVGVISQLILYKNSQFR